MSTLTGVAPKTHILHMYTYRIYIYTYVFLLTEKIHNITPTVTFFIFIIHFNQLNKSRP